MAVSISFKKVNPTFRIVLQVSYRYLLFAKVNITKYTSFFCFIRALMKSWSAPRFRSNSYYITLVKSIRKVCIQPKISPFPNRWQHYGIAIILRVKIYKHTLLYINPNTYIYLYLQRMFYIKCYKPVHRSIKYTTA